MNGSNAKKTFGQRRTRKPVSFKAAVPIPILRVDTKKQRQSERENLWCCCYVYAEEFGRELIRAATMLDFSEHGGRVRCRSRAVFPENVRLRAPRLGLDVQARTVWQEGFDAGFAFSARPR